MIFQSLASKNHSKVVFFVPDQILKKKPLNIQNIVLSKGENSVNLIYPKKKLDGSSQLITEIQVRFANNFPYPNSRIMANLHWQESLSHHHRIQPNHSVIIIGDGKNDFHC
jgi:hypothetical protein